MFNELLGDTIQIKGTAKAGFNGLYGQIADFFNEEKQRWPVSIIDFNGKEKDGRYSWRF